MRKKIFSIVFVAAIAIAAAWNFSQNQDKVALSNLALANVEALANGEGIVGSLCSKPGLGCIIKFTDGSSTYISGRWN